MAFPVTPVTLLRVNYGQFYQQPNLQDLYVSYRFLEHKVQTGGYFVGFGNPNLRPERTTAYEVGIAHQMSDNVRLDVTAYYKDVKDLVEIATIPSFPNQFSSYRNRDFATIKGVDVGFKMRPINHVSADLSYSLSYAQGTGSVSNTQGNIAWTASQPPKMTSPLDFDQRHKLALNLDYRLGKGEGPLVGGLRLFEDFGVNVLYNVASGTPYTPTKVYNEVTLAAVSTEPAGPINSRYGPWTNNLDLKATSGFRAAGLALRGLRLGAEPARHAATPSAVYGSSGSATSTGWLDTEDGQTYLQTAADAGQDGAAASTTWRRTTRISTRIRAWSGSDSGPTSSVTLHEDRRPMMDFRRRCLTLVVLASVALTIGAVASWAGVPTTRAALPGAREHGERGQPAACSRSTTSVAWTSTTSTCS